MLRYGDSHPPALSALTTYPTNSLPVDERIKATCKCLPADNTAIQGKSGHPTRRPELTGLPPYGEFGLVTSYGPSARRRKPNQTFSQTRIADMFTNRHQVISVLERHLNGRNDVSRSASISSEQMASAENRQFSGASNWSAANCYWN